MDSVRIFLIVIFAGLSFVWSCSTDIDQEIDCTSLSLVLKSSADPTTCSPSDGEIRVFAV